MANNSRITKLCSNARFAIKISASRRDCLMNFIYIRKEGYQPIMSNQCSLFSFEKISAGSSNVSTLGSWVVSTGSLHNLGNFSI